MLSLLFGICEAGGPCQASRRQPKLDTCLLCTEMSIPHALCLYLNSKHELLLPSYEEHWLLIRAALWSLDYMTDQPERELEGLAHSPSPSSPLPERGKLSISCIPFWYLCCWKRQFPPRALFLPTLQGKEAQMDFHELWHRLLIFLCPAYALFPTAYVQEVLFLPDFGIKFIYLFIFSLLKERR